MYLVVGMICIAGGLFLGLRLSQNAWNARYRANKELGDRLMIEACAALREKRPASLAEQEWESLIAATWEMLREVVGSGLLDQAGIERLSAELQDRAARVKGDEGLLEISRLWRDMEQRAGPALSRLTIPTPIELAVILNPLDRTVPAGMDPSAWSGTCDQARLALLELRSAPCWQKVDRNAWMRRWAERMLRATPGDARGILEAFLRELVDLDPDSPRRTEMLELLSRLENPR
jgi:hypothetical protein